MRRIVIASHGDMAKGMLHTARMIMGERENLSFHSLQEGEMPQHLLEELRAQIHRFPHDSFFILGDLLGGSVCSQLIHLVEEPNVHVISGMNLCMLLSVCMAEEQRDDEEVVREAIEESKRNMVYLNDLWKRKEEILNDQDDEN